MKIFSLLTPGVKKILEIVYLFDLNDCHNNKFNEEIDISRNMIILNVIFFFLNVFADM